jgi:hypothetical protein
MNNKLFVMRRTGLRQLIIIALLLLVASYSYGQIELSSGIDLSYPELLNSNNTKLNYGQITFGLKAGIAYKPEDVQFFPILNLSFGRTRLPLKQINANVAALNFNYTNVMLNENYVVHAHSNEIFIYGGIGFSYLVSKGLNIAGPGGETMKQSIDSTANITKAFPAMNIGFDYVYGDAVGKDLYLSMGVNFQFILLANSQNTYYFSVNDPKTGLSHYTADLTGVVLQPGFYIAMHYLLHPHKKSKMYL